MVLVGVTNFQVFQDNNYLFFIISSFSMFSKPDDMNYLCYLPLSFSLLYDRIVSLLLFPLLDVSCTQLWIHQQSIIHSAILPFPGLSTEFLQVPFSRKIVCSCSKNLSGVKPAVETACTQLLFFVYLISFIKPEIEGNVTESPGILWLCCSPFKGSLLCLWPPNCVSELSLAHWPFFTSHFVLFSLDNLWSEYV